MPHEIMKKRLNKPWLTIE